MDVEGSSETSGIIKKEKKKETWQIDITRQLPEDKFGSPGMWSIEGRINGKRYRGIGLNRLPICAFSNLFEILNPTV